jgi:glycosyltransferase involved in cell wall biosynthesis
VIREYLNDPQRVEREGESGYQFARKNFDREVLAGKYLEYIKDLLKAQ